MSKYGIHSRALDELHRRGAASKCVYSGIVTRKPASAPASAIQRAAAGIAVAAERRAPRRPRAIGTQMASDR